MPTRNPIEDPLRLLARGFTKLYSIWVSLTYPFASIGHDLSIHYTCKLSRFQAHQIKFGNAVLIKEDTSVNVVVSAEQNGEPIIIIDDNVGIARRCQIWAQNRIHIESDVIFAPSVLVIDHSRSYENGLLEAREHDDSEGGRIRIGQGSWIGHAATIVCTHGELVLGHNCVVAANSIISRSYPPYSVIGGNPARVIRQFDPASNKWVIGSVSANASKAQRSGHQP